MLLTKKIKLNRDFLKRITLAVSVSLISFLLLILLISTFLFIFGFKINIFIFPLSFIISQIILFLLLRKYFKNRYIKIYIFTIVILISVFLLLLLIIGNIYDISWEGQGYNQTAIIKLLEGWNPVYENVPDNVSHNIFEHIWINHSPKASWIIAASLIKLTGNIEHGKFLNLVMIIITFLISFHLLLQYDWINNKNAFIYSLLLAFNPVSIYESYFFMTDGILSSLLISLILLSILVITKNKNIIYYFLFFLILTLLINTNFNGLIFSILITITLITAVFIKSKNIEKGLKTGVISLLILLSGLFFTGYSPYIKNDLSQNNILFPAFGQNKINFTSMNSPEGFEKHNKFCNFIISLFSKTRADFGTAKIKPEFKTPFMVDGKELSSLSKIPKLGGFGPLFSGIFCVSILLFLILIYILYKEKQYKKIVLYLSVFFWIIISAVIIPQSWWARFIPHFWGLPIAVSLLIIYEINKKNDFTILKIFCKSIILKINTIIKYILALNIIIIFLTYNILILYSNEAVKNELTAMKNTTDKILIHMELFEESTKYKLKKWDINYTEDNSKGYKIDFNNFPDEEEEDENNNITSNEDNGYYKREKGKQVIKFFWNFNINEACIIFNK